MAKLTSTKKFSTRNSTHMQAKYRHSRVGWDNNDKRYLLEFEGEDDRSYTLSLAPNEMLLILRDMQIVPKELTQLLEDVRVQREGMKT